MSVTFRVEIFEGPLDLLLQLVEKNELDLSTVSLASVAEQFVAHIKETPNLSLEEVADFLVVATKLLYLKSKLLLPSLVDQELEEGPPLEEQLRRYRTFLEAAQDVHRMWDSGKCVFSRELRPFQLREVQFIAPEGVTATALHDLMQRVVQRLEPLVQLPEAAVTRVVSLQEKIRHLFQLLRDLSQTTFHALIGDRSEKMDIVVSFLALLELTKQRFVCVTQGELFQDIAIEKHPNAPARDPFAHSFVYDA